MKGYYSLPIQQFEQKSFTSSTHLDATSQLESWQLTKGESWDDPVRGNVGSMTGANNRGVVTVIVSGDAAHLTGANSSAYASMVVRGAVGSRTGEGMRDQASVFARSIRETSPNREETTRVGLLVE